MPNVTPVSRGFQVFAKPAGAVCNMACRYCYYLDKAEPEIGDRPGTGPGLSPCSISAPARMPIDLLEDYIGQHIAASSDEIIRFSWHGGEPTVLGVDCFRRIVEIQRRDRKSVV